jgi:hypothetical protein
MKCAEIPRLLYAVQLALQHRVLRLVEHGLGAEELRFERCKEVRVDPRGRLFVRCACLGGVRLGEGVLVEFFLVLDLLFGFARGLEGIAQARGLEQAHQHLTLDVVTGLVYLLQALPALAVRQRKVATGDALLQVLSTRHLEALLMALEFCYG